MNRSVGLPDWIRTRVMIGLVVTLACCLQAGVLASEGPGRTRGPESVLGKQDVVIKNYYATIRSKPSDKAELIGYLPGAMTLRVIQPRREVDGWLQVGYIFWWSTSDEAWVRLSDVASASDFQRMDGKQKWPLEYAVVWPLFYSGKRGIFLEWYPPDNRCPDKPSKSSDARLLQKAGLKSSEVAGISCTELWYLPGTNVVSASSSGGPDIGWYDRKTGDVLFLSDYMLGRVVYGYRGTYPFSCVRGISC